MKTLKKHWLVFFLLTLIPFSCKKDPLHNSEPNSVSRISVLKNLRSRYGYSYKLYAVINGKYYYNKRGQVDSIISGKPDHGVNHDNLRFFYDEKGRISKIVGAFLYAEWGGGFTKIYYYDSLGRVCKMATHAKAKDDFLEAFTFKYNDDDKIIEYTEFLCGPWSRRYFYTWDGDNISMVKIKLINYYPGAPNSTEEIIKFKYDDKPNPFKQESGYLFKPRYLCANNPIIDTSYCYKYQADYSNNSTSFLGIDTIVNHYNNTYDSNDNLLIIKKNGGVIDEIKYINIVL